MALFHSHDINSLVIQNVKSTKFKILFPYMFHELMFKYIDEEIILNISPSPRTESLNHGSKCLVHSSIPQVQNLWAIFLC